MRELVASILAQVVRTEVERRGAAEVHGVGIAPKGELGTIRARQLCAIARSFLVI